MTSDRLLAYIKSVMERTRMAQDEPSLARQLGALVQAQKDVISQLQRENASLKLRARYKRVG